MPKRRIKDGEVIQEVGTKQPTAKQLEQLKQKRINEQSEQRAKFEQEREQSAATSAPVSAPAADKTQAAK